MLHKLFNISKYFSEEMLVTHLNIVVCFFWLQIYLVGFMQFVVVPTLAKGFGLGDIHVRCGVLAPLPFVYLFTKEQKESLKDYISQEW